MITSIRLDHDLVAALRKRADSLGIGWQTLVKMILTRYSDAEL
jgi:predicted DNA binding CopG/RHH family protein